MNRLGIRDRVKILAWVCIIEGLITQIALFVIPTDPKNSLFLGYSLERWIMIVGVFISQGIFFLLVLGHPNGYLRKCFIKSLRVRGISTLFTLIFLACAGLIGINLGNNVLLLRISPLLIYVSLVCIQIVIYQLISLPQQAEFYLWATLLASVPLLFAGAIRQYFPLGYAGLYTMMAEAIAKVNFQLPMSVPFYGPGGIPFAYPPLGLFLMAMFLKLGISTWTYLRFAPPVFSLLSLIPLFLLGRRMSKSNLGGMVTSLLAAGSFYLYFLQTESGGIVRGLAFGLGLLSIYFFDRMIETFHWRDVILSGVTFGMAVLTHLGYAYYFAFWMGVWVVTHPKRQNWIGAGLVAAISTIVALPWIIIMLDRYGVSIFSNALLSHDNFNFLSLFQNPVSLFQALLNNLKSIIEQPWLLILVAAGLVCLVVQKKYTLPILLLLILFIFQGQDRYILTVSFLVVGYFISFFYRFITSKKYISNQRLEKLVYSFVLVGLFIPIYIMSFDRLGTQLPLINQEMLDMSSFMKNNTPTNASYLSIIIGDSQEDELFPYLMQREPVLAGWGSEWTGDYVVEGLEEGQLKECVTGQSLNCLEKWFLSTSKQPEFIVMNAKLEQLSASLGQSPEWKNVYANWHYMVWEHIEALP
jgi:hypothetical protein